MTVASIAAALSLFAPPAAPSPAAAATPAIYEQARPAREVVYQFTYDESQEQTTNEIGQPPDTQTMVSGYSGTLTIDILSVEAGDEVHLTIRETTDAANNKKAIVREAFLRNGGHIYFVGAEPTQDPNEEQTPESAIELYLLLPYLAPDWPRGSPLDKGSSWKSDRFGDFRNIGVKYSVSAVAKDVVTIDAASTPNGPSPGAMTLEERLVYDRASLLPTSLDAYASLLQNSDESIDAHAHYHFKLASDTALQAGGLR